MTEQEINQSETSEEIQITIQDCILEELEPKHWVIKSFNDGTMEATSENGEVFTGTHDDFYQTYKKK